MSYRPITDIWLLTRAKLKNGHKYYGAYLGGFPERARALIGCAWHEPLLHVCGGRARDYPYRAGFGPRDETMDIDPDLSPNVLGDATEQIPANGWSGILIDPPYSEADAAKYRIPNYPNPHILVKNAIGAVDIGRKVGIIHYIVPRCPKNAKFVALVGVACGFGNRLRAFSVFERLT